MMRANVVETREHLGDFKERFVRIRSRTLSDSFSACSGRELVAIGGGHLNMKTQIPNINMLRFAWRRTKKKKKDATMRDLKPVKDVKAGGATSESHHRRGGATGSTGRH